jgi:hypothetical protein
MSQTFENVEGISQAGNFIRLHRGSGLVAMFPVNEVLSIVRVENEPDTDATKPLKIDKKEFLKK